MTGGLCPSLAKLIDFPPDISELRGGRGSLGRERQEGKQDQCDQDCLLCERETGLWMMTMIAYRIFAVKATALSVIFSPHNNSFWVHSQLEPAGALSTILLLLPKCIGSQETGPARPDTGLYPGDTNYHNWNREHGKN